MNLLIVSSYNDIEYVRKNKGDFLLVTGFTSVANYFKKNNFSCVDLNELISDKFKEQNYLKFQKEYYNLLKKKKIYYQLFRNKYLINYVGFIFFSKILKKILKEKKINKIVLLDSIKEKFDQDEFLFQVLINVIKNFTIDLKVINYHRNSFSKVHSNFIHEFKRLVSSLKYSLKIRDKKKENIFLLEKTYLGLKNLKFFLGQKYNIFYFKKINQFPEVNIFFSKGKKKNFIKLINELFLEYFSKFLKSNNKLIQQEKKFFFDLLKKNKIKKIAWFFSPCELDISAILIDEAFKRNIEVLGFQHGGIYGVMDENNPNNIQHHVNDYKFCNIFHSYSDFKIKKNIFFKNYKISKFKQIKFFEDYKIKPNTKKILYVPQNVTHMFKSKYSFSSDYFYNEQKKICDFLINDIQDNFQVFFKMYNNLSQNFIESYYPIHPYIVDKIKSKKNFSFVEEKTIIEFIKKEKPSTIILDYISTPLWEVIKFPVNILIFNDNKFFKLNKNFLKLLKKRIYFFNNKKELKKIIHNLNFKKFDNKQNIKKFIL